jgi:hypothetical protein
MLKARLHPHRAGTGYRYSVLFQGELLVDRSRDPECDAARALLAQGSNVMSYRERRFVERPRVLEVLDFEVLRFA